MIESRRRLICISIFHTQEDMGSLGKRLPASEDYREGAHAFWVEIQRQVQALALNWSGVRIYQDGLPDAPSEIVQKILNEVRSPNYDLLRWLIAQGAEVIGTESPALIKEEYMLLAAVHTAKNARVKAKARRDYAARAGELLAERDSYIARRIADTLPLGSAGLLLIGHAHDVAKYLPSEIAIEWLCHG